MELEPIIEHLRARCPTFAGRFAGAAEYRPIPESTSVPVPCGFVIPLDDNPEPNSTQNSVSQQMTESFAVIVALSNADERGQAATGSVHAARRELWKALVGWEPAEDYGAIEYQGGHLLTLDRSRMWFQFEFGSGFHIGPEDGYQQGAQEAFPHFEGASIKVEVIDPIVDHNLAPTGPDGRIEQELQINNLP